MLQIWLCRSRDNYVGFLRGCFYTAPSIHTVSQMKWDGETNIYTVVLFMSPLLIMLLTTVIYIYFAYVANFIKIHCTVSEINVFKTWHLKCELSNIARASRLLPKSRSISEQAVHQWRVRLRECVRAKNATLSTDCNQRCAAWLSHVGKLSFFGVSI